MATSPGSPKPTFYLAILAVVAALIGLSVWRCNTKGDTSKTKEGAVIGDIDPNIVKQAPMVEDDVIDGATSVKEYELAPADTLKPVEGTAAYPPLGGKRIVKFAINIWAGWAPIILANGGKGPGKIWKDAKGKDFQVQLELMDDPVSMATAFATGNLHIAWNTVDMLPLTVQRLNRDPRTMPRVFQQTDWSNGGDGIIARSNIKNIGDLKGKRVALAQASPSHYFLLNALLNGGVQPKTVTFEFYKDPFQAAAAFARDPGISAAVSWAPDIYTIPEKVPGTKLLLSTKTANKLIAAVWFARADFARDNPDIIEGLVRGIFDGIEDLKDDANKDKAAALMDTMYKLPAGTGKSMLGDAHWTNFAENRAFFLNQNNPTNFENTYETAYQLYDAARFVNMHVRFDEIVDLASIKDMYSRLGEDPRFKNQQDEYQVQFTPVSASAIDVESAVITKTVSIKFFPNSFELMKKVPPPAGGPEVFYDPDIEKTLKEIAQLSQQYGAARIKIEGHTDGSKRGEADESLVRELSLNRANAVKQYLVNTYQLQLNQFIVAGYGWDQPADKSDPNNHTKNRRVEIKVIPAEAQ